MAETKGYAEAPAPAEFKDISEASASNDKKKEKLDRVAQILATQTEKPSKAVLDRAKATAAAGAAAQEKPAEAKDSENTFNVDIDNIEFEVETEPADMVDEDYEFYPDTSDTDMGNEEYQDDRYSYRFGRRPYRGFNKHIFTWLFSFVLGMYGGDRFIRGQIGLGVLKLLTFGGFGFWYFADFAVALYKSYVSGFASDEDVVFDQFGNYCR